MKSSGAMPSPKGCTDARKRLASVLLKGGVSTALLWWVLREADGRALIDTLADVPLLLVAAALGLTFIQTLLLAWRWHRIVQLLGGSLSITKATALTFLGLFANQALPTSVGGDLVRAWGLYRLGTAPGISISSVVVERLTGLATLGMLVTACLPEVWVHLPEGPVRIALLAAGPSILVALAVFGAAERFTPNWFPAALRRLIGAVGQAFRSLSARPAALAEIAVLGAAASLTGLGAAYALGGGIGIPIGFPAYVSLIGGVVLFSILPISIGGWGVREAAMLFMFGGFGITSEQALALSLLFGILPLAISLPAVFLWHRLTPMPQDAIPPPGGAAFEKGVRGSE